MIDSYGNPLWADGGAEISVDAGVQGAPRVVSDGAGGVIVVWQDSRWGGWDIYAQRLNSGGYPMWDPNGVPICTATGDQWQAEIATDGYGGAIITWRDGRYGESDLDIFAQRISGAGNVQWTVDGVVICFEYGHQYNPQIAADGTGGAVIVWNDYRSGFADVFAQRVSGEGFALWTPNGVAVSTAAADQIKPKVAWGEAGRTLIAWEDGRSYMGSDIYAQALNAGGDPLWTADGVPVCTASSYQYIIDVMSDESAGLIVAWNDWRGPDWDIYAQRVNSAGAVQWMADGIYVCVTAGDQWAFSMAPDGFGSAVIAWQDSRNDFGDIYAQRFGGTYGGTYWNYGGVPLCTAGGQQEYPLCATDGDGGAIVCWGDRRSVYDCDLYANRVDHNGYWGYPSPWLTDLSDVPNDQGGRLMLTWNASRLDHWSQSGIQYYSVWRMLPMAAAQALLAAGVKETAPEKIGADFAGPAYRFRSAAGTTTAYEWITNLDAHYLPEYSYAAPTLCDFTWSDPGWHYFFVSAHADAGIFWDSPVGVAYSVDNLAPCVPLSLEGERSYAPAGLLVSWAPNHEGDLGGYHLYRGTDPDFVPDPSNMIASTCDTLLLDEDWTWEGGYCYKLVAVDIHGNESAYALLTPEDVTGAETPKAPDASYLAQNYPNPFNPVTRIAFGLAAPASASLRIYDAAGRLVRVVADGSRPAGHFAEVWDGRNMRGEAMASGVYFYRLDAGSFTQTKKMILLR
jgi:hypothetical protein